MMRFGKSRFAVEGEVFELIVRQDEEETFARVLAYAQERGLSRNRALITLLRAGLKKEGVDIR